MYPALTLACCGSTTLDIISPSATAHRLASMSLPACSPCHGCSFDSQVKIRVGFTELVERTQRGCPPDYWNSAMHRRIAENASGNQFLQTQEYSIKDTPGRTGLAEHADAVTPGFGLEPNCVDAAITWSIEPTCCIGNMSCTVGACRGTAVHAITSSPPGVEPTQTRMWATPLSGSSKGSILTVKTVDASMPDAISSSPSATGETSTPWPPWEAEATVNKAGSSAAAPERG